MSLEDVDEPGSEMSLSGLTEFLRIHCVKSIMPKEIDRFDFSFSTSRADCAVELLLVEV